MPGIAAKSLIGKLNATCRRGMEAAAGLCLSRTHFNVEIEHWLLKLLEPPDTDLPIVLRHYDIDVGKAKRRAERGARPVQDRQRPRRPSCSVEILDLIREAWVLASLEYGAGRVRCGAPARGPAQRPHHSAMRLKAASPELAKLPAEKLQKELRTLLAHVEAARRPSRRRPRPPRPSATADAPAAGPGSSQDAVARPVHHEPDRAGQGRARSTRSSAATSRSARSSTSSRAAGRTTRSSPARPASARRPSSKGFALRIVAGDVPRAAQERRRCARSTSACCRPGPA